MAVLQSADERQAEAAVARVRSDAVTHESAAQLTRTLVLAAALTVGAELLLQRLAPPILAQVASPGSALAKSVASAGELAANGGAVLVFLAVAGLALWSGRLAPVLLAAAVAVMVASVWTAPGASLAVHVVVVAAAGSIGLRALRRARTLFTFGLALAASAVVVGQLPLLAEAAWPEIGPFGIAASGVAELLIVAAVLTLAASLLAEKPAGPIPWAAAAISAIAVAGALTFQPGFSAIGAIWVVGIILALPPIFYIATAGAAGLLVAGWSMSRATRPLAAAVVLLAAAGIQPQVLHHDLTALLALAVLAGFTGANTREWS